MLEHRKAARTAAAAMQPSTSTTSVTPSTACITSQAACAQKLGIARLNALDDALERSLSGMSETSTPNTNTYNPVSSQSANTELSTEEAETAERWSMELDELAVDDELRRYEAAGILAGNELDDFDILQYWQVSRSFDNHSKIYHYLIWHNKANKHTLPLLYPVVLDVLPVQASSVPCESVFSSGKETTTARRSKLDPLLMEILQMLKYIFRGERLNFTSDLVDLERDLTAVEEDYDEARCLLLDGRIDELMQRLDPSMAVAPH